MATINIRIVGADETAGTILVKFASENSARVLDEYPPIGFPITSTSVTNADSFIDSIRTQVSYMVAMRDAIELHVNSLDFTDWIDYEKTVVAADVVDPFVTSQLVEGLNNPEVTL